MSYKYYIKDENNKDESYKRFIQKNNINFNNDFSNEKSYKPYKPKHFKLSIGLTMLLLIISLSIVGVNYINKPKYQEYHFTEQEIEYMKYLGGSGVNSWIGDNCYYRNLFIEPCCSLYKGKISSQYYIVGYLSYNDKMNNPTAKGKFKATTWYIFKDKTAPYRVDKEKEAWVVIKYLEIAYSEDLSTGYQFDEDLIEINYLYCDFQIDEEKNTIEYQEIEYRCTQINEIFLRKHGESKVYNEKDLELVRKNINAPYKIYDRYITASGTPFHDSREAVNHEFYNLTIIDDKHYMQIDLYEIKNGEKHELGHIKRWEELGEQLTEIKAGEIVSEDGRYIMGLYPLDEVVKIVKSIQ